MKAHITLGTAAALWLIASPSYAAWGAPSAYVVVGQTAYCDSATGGSAFRRARIRVVEKAYTMPCEPELGCPVPPTSHSFWDPEGKNVTNNGKRADIIIRAIDSGGNVFRSIHDNVRDTEKVYMSWVGFAFYDRLGRARCNVATENEVIW